MTHKELAWSAPEFEYHHKSQAWYVGMVFTGFALFALALWQGNFLFAIFVITAAVLLLATGKRVPRYIDFRLTDEALIVDGRQVYPFVHLVGFATRRIDDLDDGLSELIIRQKHRLSSYLKVLYPTAHTQEIRHFLNQHMPEIEYDDSLADHLARWLKF